MPVPEHKRGNLASVRLDAVRGMAALFVVLNHLRALFFVEYDQVTHKSTTVKILYLLTGLGHEAVVIFFVLSGYLISSSVIRSVQSERWDWRVYAINRLTRLYVVLVPALLLGVLWDCLGPHLFRNAGIYTGLPVYSHIMPEDISHLISVRTWLGNILFLQGVAVPTFGSNGPLWSLSYEFWYYVLFPLCLLALWPKTSIGWRLTYIALALSIAKMLGPKIDTYFAVWLMGVAIFVARPVKLCASRLFLPITGSAFLLSLMVSRQHIADSVAANFIIGIAFCAFLYGLLDRQNETAHPLYRKGAQALSGMSYTLYLVHVPFLVFLNGLIIRDGQPWQPTGPHLIAAFLLCGAVFLYTCLVWYFTEARTDTVRQSFKRLRLSKMRRVSDLSLQDDVKPEAVEAAPPMTGEKPAGIQPIALGQ